MVEETPGGGWDRGEGGHGGGLIEAVGRQGRFEKLGRWGLIDVMPCAGDLDEGRNY